MDQTDRISTIGSSILSQAVKESRRLIDEANAIRERELKAAEEKIVVEMGERLQKQSAAVRHECMAEAASERTHSRQALLRRRGDHTRLIFMGAKARLAEYAKTEEYKTAMLKEIEDIRDSYDHRSSTVYMRAEDLRFAREIQGLLAGAGVEADENIRIGGWKLLNTAASILIDQSLDTRLSDSKEWFLEHCNMEVT